MSKIDVKIPAIGESVTEVTLTSWLVADGDYVNEGDLLCEVESDKATLEIPAENSGKISISAEEGSDLEIGATIASLDTAAEGEAKSEQKEETKKEEDPQKSEQEVSSSNGNKNYPSPAAKKILSEKGIDESSVSGSGKDGRITKADAMNAKAEKKSEPSSEQAPQKTTIPGSREKRVEKMTRLRKTIAKRLVEAKNTTAMLTTFNEVDMTAIMELRKKYKDLFKEKHDISLGFMSFFTKACCVALQEIPSIGAMIDGEEIIFHDYADVGIAVSTPKGLVVPVVKNAESMSLADIEKEIRRLALKGRDGKLTIDEMQGGNFTITNGGVFGSMLSTPILNIPQSAILGMHNIVDRPHVVDGEIKIRPIMYLALSYDHRIVDGKESVTFLVKVKEMLEDPARLLLNI